MPSILPTVLFYAIPLLLAVLFLVSLIRYTVAKSRNKRVPGSYSEEQLTRRKNLFLVSAFLFGTLLVAVIGVMALLFFAVAFM